MHDLNTIRDPDLTVALSLTWNGPSARVSALFCDKFMRDIADKLVTRPQ